jgi:MFS family permease
VPERGVLYAAAFLRATATGLAGVLAGIHLAETGFDPAEIGYVVGAGLAGAAVAALGVTLAGDRLGRRASLIGLSAIAGMGGIVVALAADFAVAAAAAFAGMLNGMGRDRGACTILDQAILPATTTDAQRTAAFAWYHVLQDAGHAAGALLAAAPTLVAAATGLGRTEAIRATFAGHGALLLATAVVYLGLSRAAERAGPEIATGRVSPGTRRVLWRISSLFALDSLAGGFLTTALLAYFFHERFGASETAVAFLFFGARVANAGSHLGAAWLARRIGLVNTMVWTHVPSSLLLLTVPYAPSFPAAAVLFLVREGLVEMDVPTRQSYVMAVVRPEERTLASGVTHLVRLAGWAAAPAFAGVLMANLGLGTPLVVGATMKIVYDLLLWAAFRRERPPEERG